MKPAAGTVGTSAAPAASHATAAGRSTFSREILGAFSPNRVISKAAFRFIIVFQVAVLLIVWATSTYVFLPKPMDVWRAFVDLWTHEGLGQELIVSFLLNVQALAWATLIEQEADDEFLRSEEHTSELQSRFDLVCRLLLEQTEIRI